jgi:hypothetical protein
VTRGNDLFFRPGQPAYCGQSWAAATERSRHVGGLCPWCCRADAVLAAHRAGARRGPPCPVARVPRPGCCPAGSAGPLPPPWPGCAAAASRSASPGGVPADLAGCAAGISRRPGTPARCLAARAWHRPGSAAGARTVSPLMPAAGSGRDAIHGPAPDDRPAPHSRATGPPAWYRRSRHLRFHRHGQDLAGLLRASPELPAWRGGTGAGGLPVPPAGSR